MDTQNEPNPQQTRTQRHSDSRNYQRRARRRMDSLCILQRQCEQQPNTPAASNRADPVDCPAYPHLSLDRPKEYRRSRNTDDSCVDFYTVVGRVDPFHFRVWLRLYLSVSLECASLQTTISTWNRDCPDCVRLWCPAFLYRKTGKQTSDPNGKWVTEVLL